MGEKLGISDSMMSFLDPGGSLFSQPDIPVGQMEDFIRRMTPQALAALRGGTREAVALSGEAAQQAEGRLAPFGGTQAFDETAALLGALGPEAQERAIQNIPLPEAKAFQEEQEQRQLMASAAARGELGGGATLAGATELGSAQIGRRIADRLASLAPLADVERGTASTISGLRESAATRAAQLLAGLGPQEASIRLGTAAPLAEARSSAAEIGALQTLSQAQTRSDILNQFSQLMNRPSATPATTPSWTTYVPPSQPINIQPGTTYGR
jgi:hypothetical protein